MRASQAGWCVLLCALVAACGGGGGGGGDTPRNTNTLRFTLDRTAIAFDYEEGAARPSQQVVATASGEYEGELFVAVIIEGNAIDPNVPIAINEVQGTFTFTAAAGLAPGDYSGRILLLACSDQACNNRVGNTPLAVTYTVRVRRTLHVAPTSVSMAAVSGSSASAELTVQLPDGQTAHSVDIIQGGSWLTASVQSPTSTLLTAKSMPSGTLQALIAVSSGNRTINVPVTYAVSAPPGGEHGLLVNPRNLTLVAREGAVSQAQALETVAPTWDAAMPTTVSVNYADFGASWLTVAPSANGYQVTASAQNLRASTRNAEIVVSGVEPAQPVTVFVSFTIGLGLVQPADVSLLVDSTTTPTSPVLTGSVPIDVTEGAPAPRTAVSDSSWLVLTRASGQTGSSVQYSVDRSLIPFMANYGDSVAVVTVTPTTAAITPVQFSIRLRKELALITGLGPSYQLSDRAARIIVRGRGFIANRDWSQHLHVAGAPAGAGNVTRVNDTELLVDLPLPAGDMVVFEPTNGLGIPFGSDSLKVVLPRTYPYTAIPTGFPVRSIEYYPRPEMILAVDTTPGAGGFRRYTRFLNAWTAEPAIAVAQITDAAFSNNGAQIRATTSTGVRFFSSDTGGGGGPLDVPQGMAPITSGRNLAPTNDGRLWLNVGSVRHDLAYFDPFTLSLVTVESPLTNFVGGPWFGVSRNGERLVISQADNATPAPPLLYLDAADAEIKVAPFDQETGDTYSPNATMSDDASRMVLNNFRVRDREFNQIGHVAVAQATDDNFIGLNTSVVVSPDGTRAYVLAQEASDLDVPTPQFLPRVYVFDISTPGPAAQRMPLLGHFELSDYPACVRFIQCDRSVAAAISPDGKTLFYGGNQHILIVPIPAEGTLSALRSIHSAKPGGPLRTVRWDLKVRRD